VTTTESRPAAPQREIGAARTRKEDARLITGRTSWTDNIVLPGMVHLAMVRSPLAHATISSVSTDAAADAPGVLGVWAGRDFPEQGGLACVWPVTAGMNTPTRLPVAVDTVRYTGEIVAVVAARSKAEAVDAAELVEVQ
jgi:carbon-monoxide dehydrogenase large subunit